MKKVIMLTMCIALCFSVPCLAKEKKIKKIKKNHVEIQTIMYEDSKGKIPVIVHSESYGRDRLNNELVSLSNRLVSAENMDWIAYGEKKIQSIKDQIDILNTVKTEMDK